MSLDETALTLRSRLWRVSGLAVALMLQLVPFQCSASVRLEVDVALVVPTAQASFAFMTVLL
jgi:hypothetical protein